MPDYNDPWTWVWLAAKVEDDPKALHGVLVQQHRLVGTDRSRLHLVEQDQEEPADGYGVYANGALIAPTVKYPEVKHTIPEPSASALRLSVDDSLIWLLSGANAAVHKWEKLSKSTTAAAPYKIGFLCEDGTTALVQPGYVLDAVLGMQLCLIGDEPTVQAASTDKPVVFRCDSGEQGGKRTAVIMPVRTIDTQCIVSLADWLSVDKEF